MAISVISVYRLTGCIVGSLHLDSVKQVAAQWVGRQEHGKCTYVLRDISNTIFFKIALEFESSECLLF